MADEQITEGQYLRRLISTFPFDNSVEWIRDDLNLEPNQSLLNRLEIDLQIIQRNSWISKNPNLIKAQRHLALIILELRKFLARNRVRRWKERS